MTYEYKVVKDSRDGGNKYLVTKASADPMIIGPARVIADCGYGNTASTDAQDIASALTEAEANA